MKRRLLIGLLILAGALLLLAPFLKEEVIGLISRHAAGEKLTSVQMADNNKRRASFDYQAILPPSIAETLKSGLHIDRAAIIGHLSIKSVDINLPILKGTTNAHLLFGATTMRADQQMGHGNYPLAGHHMRNDSILFSPLMRIKIGDRAVITDGHRSYVYQVFDKRIVSETDGSVIASTADARLTLITCDKATKTSKRLVVVGKLVQVTKNDRAD
ncbi:MAG: class A sortase [Sporolactobacillus sp.]